MDSPPSLETVYQAVYSLYRDTNPAESGKASLWLGELQKSVSLSGRSQSEINYLTSLLSIIFHTFMSYTNVHIPRCIYVIVIQNGSMLRSCFLTFSWEDVITEKRIYFTYFIA